VNRRTLFVLTLSIAGAGIARAQIIQPRLRTTPIAWTSLSIGWLQQAGFCNGDTGACYDFGSGPQWRVSLEMPMGMSGSTTVGIVGTTAKMPLIYRGGSLPLPSGANSCSSCDADANITQILGLLRMGGGTGFHQVIDVMAGTTMFSNFRSTTGTKLGNGKLTQNVSFGLGYGFGYGITPRTQINIVQDYGLLILKRQSGNSNNVAQQSTLRLSIRYGLGDKGSRY
jgi:hypothetical protein